MKTEPDAAGMSEGRLERITEHFSSAYVEPGKIAGCQFRREHNHPGCQADIAEPSCLEYPAELPR